MRLLLDTHVLLWWLADDPSLSSDAKQLIAHDDNEVVVSAVSIWEIAIKRGLGKLEIPDDWFDAIIEEPFQRLPITFDHSRRVGDLPDLHRDPFDRLLVAQAVVEGLTLVTRDDHILQYDVHSVPV